MDSDPFQAYRELERWLFQGVTELPEPIWKDDPNALVAERRTGRSQLVGGLPADWDDGAEIAFAIVYDPESKQIEYVPVMQNSSTDTDQDCP